MGFAPSAVRPGHPRARLAGAGRQRRPARRHVRARAGPSAGTDRASRAADASGTPGREADPAPGRGAVAASTEPAGHHPASTTFAGTARSRAASCASWQTTASRAGVACQVTPPAIKPSLGPANLSSPTNRRSDLSKRGEAVHEGHRPSLHLSKAGSLKRVSQRCISLRVHCSGPGSGNGRPASRLAMACGPARYGFSPSTQIATALSLHMDGGWPRLSSRRWARRVPTLDSPVRRPEGGLAPVLSDEGDEISSGRTSR